MKTLKHIITNIDISVILCITFIAALTTMLNLRAVHFIMSWSLPLTAQILFGAVLILMVNSVLALITLFTWMDWR